MQKGCKLTHQICWSFVSSPYWSWRTFLAILFRGCIQSFLIKENIFHSKLLYHTKRILSAFVNSVSIYTQSILIKQLPWFTLKKISCLTCRVVVQTYNFLACSPTFSLLSTQKSTTVPVPHSQTMLACTRVHSNAQHAQRLIDVSSAGHRKSVSEERWSNQGWAGQVFPFVSAVA